MNSTRRLLAVALRVLRQIMNDHRTIALMLVVPSLLTGLFSWMFNDSTLLIQSDQDLSDFFLLLLCSYLPQLAL